MNGVHDEGDDSPPAHEERDQRVLVETIAGASCAEIPANGSAEAHDELADVLVVAHMARLRFDAASLTVQSRPL